MSRARIPVAVVVVALLWSLGASVLTLSSGHVADAERTVALGLLVCWSFTLAGAVAWWRRPGHPFALLMMAAGLLSITGSLQGADNRWIFTAGLLFANIATGLYVQAILAYPEGRLPSRAARALVGVAYLLVTVGALVELLFIDTAVGCAGRCPENLLAVTDDPGIADAVDLATSLIGIGVGFGVVVLLAGRIRRASAPRRRALLPMLTASAVTAAFFIAHLIAHQVSEPLARDLSAGTMVSLALVPLAFLLGLLRSQLAGLSVRELLVQLGRGVEPGGLRDALARALRDPSLAVAYWLPAAGGWVDQEGEPVELPEPGSGRAVTEIEQEGKRVAALVHDPVLLDEPGLLDAVGAATGLALANERLQAELRAYVHDLERERDFSNAIVGTVPSLLVVFDAGGRIIEFNRACEQLTGYRADEVRGRPLWDLLLPEAERAAVQAALRPEALPNENENHWLTRGGERRLILWRNTAVLGPGGHVDFVIGGGIDITERKAQEAEVKAQRARIVEAADAERRRLERNLHDGAQQRLVSLSLTLRLARARVQSEPPAAEQLLDTAAEELSQALADLRELARGIHPAILTDRGLAPALDALVARTPLPVDVEDGLPGRLPGPVEAAAYYVVSEALANASKYAAASAVTVTIRQVDGHAIVEVRDDGAGGADPAAGTGLRGLRDRVEALEGRLTVTSPLGAGTTIVAELPCAS
jgi:PAS domain S-box-containing protein